MKRLAIYKENMVKAKKIQDMDQGSAKYGETVFSDLSGCCFVVVHHILYFLNFS